jgi:SAM-dependent methyltransferase
MDATPVTCRVCGAANPPGALFCTRCTSPVAVVPLSKLDESDLRTCLGALLTVLGEELAAGAATPTQIDGDLWRAYLSSFWLRPETALILYAEALAVREATKGETGPWLDLGCGDGIHSAIQAGWRLDESFDAFQSLDVSALDIYDRFDPAGFKVNVSRTGKPVDVGLDIKATAVARAKALPGVFASAEQADATRLPLADRGIGTIFSNMLRDLGEPLGRALDECRRVLRDDGVLLISAMTPAYAQSLYFAPEARRASGLGQSDRARHMLRLDRGRSIFCQRQLSPDQWDKLLREHGLRVAAVYPIVGPAVIRFWDIGLRPFAMALLRQRQAWIDQGVLSIVKPSIVALLNHLLTPLLARLRTGEPCMNLIAAVKA